MAGTSRNRLCHKNCKTWKSQNWVKYQDVTLKRVITHLAAEWHLWCSSIIPQKTTSSECYLVLNWRTRRLTAWECRSTESNRVISLGVSTVECNSNIKKNICKEYTRAFNLFKFSFPSENQIHLFWQRKVISLMKESFVSTIRECTRQPSWPKHLAQFNRNRKRRSDESPSRSSLNIVYIN